MKRAVAAALVCIGTLAIGTVPSSATENHGGGFGSHNRRTSIDLWLNRQHDGEHSGTNVSTDHDSPRSNEYLVASYVPACPGNHPGTQGQGVDALCAAALHGCDTTPDPDDISYWRYARAQYRDGTPPGRWTYTGSVCLRPRDVPDPARPPFTLADFRRLPIRPATAHVQPASGRVLLNVPTNLYLDAPEQDFDVTLLGVPFQVRALPVAYTWTFGPGDSLTTHDPGAAFPAMTTTHTYTAPGTTAITLATTFRGEYRFAGSPWISVDGTATITSPAIPVTAVEARSVLVADQQHP